MLNQRIGSTENLYCDHLISQSRKYPRIFDDVVRECKKCNFSKGGTGVCEWFKRDLRYEAYCIIEGEYSAILYSLHSKGGCIYEVNGPGIRTLDMISRVGGICENCDELTGYVGSGSNGIDDSKCFQFGCSSALVLGILK